MSNPEFSDTFTTLLNSYNTQAQFGEQASQREIVLDEYEKSVLLTQAQDIIVKSYFESSGNSTGQGFDDSIRRQVDFSSLIRVADLDSSDDSTTKFDERGIIYELPKNSKSASTDVLFILNEKLIVSEYIVREGYYPATSSDPGALYVAGPNEYQTTYEQIFIDEVTPYYGENTLEKGQFVVHKDAKTTSPKEYVVVPINYKEYDREMSKPYAQPLKKQAWRLFQNQSTGFDIHSELIPKFNLIGNDTSITFRIRYVKRPQPIVLEDLPNGLTIDGYNKETKCELNPILHMDILAKAVELALTTRGAAQPATKRSDSQQ